MTLGKHSQAWSAVAMASMVLALVVVPGLSSATNTVPVLSGTLPGSGYVAVKVDWRGVGDLMLELNLGEAPGAKSNGVAVVGPDGTYLAMIAQSSGVLGNADCVVVRTHATGSIQDSCEPSTMQRVVFPPDGEGGRVAIMVSERDGDVAGVWTLVAWQAFRPQWQKPGHWTLTGDGDVVGVTTSDRAFVVTAPDFENGHALSASFAGAFVSANVESSFAFEIEHTLFGFMRPDGFTGKTPGMSLNGPLGSRSCACEFFSAMPSHDGPPGAYVVELDRVGGGLQLGTEATVFVMDLKLPE